MDIQVFNNDQFGNVRALSLNDEPWFVAKDVCDVLGIKTNHLREDGRGLDDDEILSLPNWEGRGSAPLIVSEAGFYKLVMRSRKPEAKAFQRWVTHEVLPAIRRTGGYMVAKQDETPEEIMARAVLVAQDTIERQKREIAELKPKALFADAVETSKSTCSVGYLAKILKQNGMNIGRNRLFSWLRDNGFLGKTGKERNIPLQRYVDQGLFTVSAVPVQHSSGEIVTNFTVRVTGKGQRYFVDLFAKRGEFVG